MVRTISDVESGFESRASRLSRDERLSRAFRQRGFSRPDRFDVDSSREVLEAERESFEAELSAGERFARGLSGSFKRINEDISGVRDPLLLESAIRDIDSRRSALVSRVPQVEAAGRSKRLAAQSRADAGSLSQRVPIQIGRQTKARAESLARDISNLSRIERLLKEQRKDVVRAERTGVPVAVTRRAERRSLARERAVESRRDREAIERFEAERSLGEGVFSTRDGRQVVVTRGERPESTRELLGRLEGKDFSSAGRLSAPFSAVVREPNRASASFEPQSLLNNGVPASFETAEGLARKDADVRGRQSISPSQINVINPENPLFNTLNDFGAVRRGQNISGGLAGKGVRDLREGRVLEGVDTLRRAVRGAAFERGRQTINFVRGFATDNRVRQETAESIGRFVAAPVLTSQAFLTRGLVNFRRDPLSSGVRVAGGGAFDVGTGVVAGRLANPLVSAGVSATRSGVASAGRVVSGAGRKVSEAGASLRNFARDRVVIESRADTLSTRLGSGPERVNTGFSSVPSDRFRLRVSVPESQPRNKLSPVVSVNKDLIKDRISSIKNNLPKNPLSIDRDVNPFSNQARIRIGTKDSAIVFLRSLNNPVFEKKINLPNFPKLPDFSKISALGFRLKSRLPSKSDFSVVKSDDLDTGFRNFSFLFRGKPFFNVAKDLRADRSRPFPQLVPKGVSALGSRLKSRLPSKSDFGFFRNADVDAGVIDFGFSFRGKPFVLGRRIVAPQSRPFPQLVPKGVSALGFRLKSRLPSKSDFSVVKSDDLDTGFRNFSFLFRGKPFFNVAKDLRADRSRPFPQLVPQGVKSGIPKIKFLELSAKKIDKVPVREFRLVSNSRFLGALLRPFARRRLNPDSFRFVDSKPRKVVDTSVPSDPLDSGAKLIDSAGGTRLVAKTKKPRVKSRESGVSVRSQGSGFAPLGLFARSTGSSLSLNRFSGVGDAVSTSGASLSSVIGSSSLFRSAQGLSGRSGSAVRSGTDSRSLLRSGQSVAQSTGFSSVIGGRSISRPVPTDPDTPLVPRATLDPTDDRVEAGFFTEVRRGGRFVRVGAGASSRADALRRGAEIASTSAVMSFRAVPSGSKVRTDSPKLSKGFVDRFRKKPDGVFVEKRKDAINSAGELRDITRKGRARRGFGL